MGGQSGVVFQQRLGAHRGHSRIAAVGYILIQPTLVWGAELSTHDLLHAGNASQA